MNTITYHVFQRAGNKWKCVGQFQAPPHDVNRRDGLRTFLWDAGIQNPRPRLYSARPAKAAN